MKTSIAFDRVYNILVVKTVFKDKLDHGIVFLSLNVPPKNIFWHFLFPFKFLGHFFACCTKSVATPALALQQNKEI